METLAKYGITDYDHGARQVVAEDFADFDYIFAMDTYNLRDLQRVQRRLESKGEKPRARVMLFGEYSGKRRAEEVGDPYYGADDGFEEVYEQVARFSRNFLAQEVDNDSTQGSSEGHLVRSRVRG
jgi:low molecular weight phosphotyrosine protein phosphatase